MSDEEKRIEKTDDIMGEFGFRVVWSYQPHWADVKVYSVVSRGDLAGTAMFPAKGWTNSSQQVTDVEHAETYLTGTMTPDGAGRFEFSRMEWAGEQDFIKHAMLLNYLCRMSRQLFAGLPHA